MDRRKRATGRATRDLSGLPRRACLSPATPRRPCRPQRAPRTPPAEAPAFSNTPSHKLLSSSRLPGGRTSMNRTLSLPQPKTPTKTERLRTARRPPSCPIRYSRLLRGERDQVSQRREPGESLALELTNALARQIELVADRLERPRLAFEAEAELEDAALPLGQGVQCAPNPLAPERLFGLVERVRGLAIGEEIAELALVVSPDGLVQRHGRLRGAERLVHVLNRQAGRLGELVLRRLAPKLDLEPARRARQLLLPLDDMHRHADRAGVIRDGTLNRLADPPGRVRRELVAAPPVELLDRAVEAERALLDQVQEGDAEPAITLGDGDDQAQVGLDHAPLRDGIATLDRQGLSR